MHCTACGGEIAAGTKFCANCGAEQNGVAKQQPEARANSVAKGCGALVVIIGGLAILGALFGGDNKQQETAEQAARPTLTVTAQELYDAYDANEARAQQTYGASKLVVNGTVAGVDLDFADEPGVLLSTDNEFIHVHADLADDSKKKAASLSKGNAITLRCSEISEVVGTPMLKGCSF